MPRADPRENTIGILLIPTHYILIRLFISYRHLTGMDGMTESKDIALTRLLTKTIYYICHTCLEFQENVHVNGKLEFKIDNMAKYMININEYITPNTENTVEVYPRSMTPTYQDNITVTADINDTSSDASENDDSDDEWVPQSYKNIQSKSKSPPCNNVNKEVLHENVSSATEVEEATKLSAEIEEKSAVPHPYHCDKCDKSYTRRWHLKVHYKRVHKCSLPVPAPVPKGKIYVSCPKCDKLIPKGYKLREHMRVHTGERPFQCTECGKRFTNRTFLNVHGKTHTGERPHSCQFCHKTFAQKSTLTSHMSVHTGVRNHQCPLCGKLFRSRSNLNKHVMTHKTSKDWPCDICGKAFTRRESLSMHKLRHVGLKRYKCDICGKSFSYKIVWSNHN